MSDQVLNGIIAVVAGAFVAVLLLMPVAFVQYRRDGRFGPGDIATLVAAAVYGLALWTYTLLPIPNSDDFTCVPAQTDFLASVREVWWSRGLHEPRFLVEQFAFQQLVFNVALFVPLGFFVRLILRRGIVVGTLVGFSISLLIEVTQWTGVWGLWHCAYRVFDVDDLICNTLGAFLGSVVAAAFIRRRRRVVALPTRISLGRRWVAMISDGLFIVLVGAGAAIAWRGWQIYARHVSADQVPMTAQHLLQYGLPLAAQGLMVLLAGRTVGEWVVSLRTVGPTWGRVPKLVLGVGAFVALLATATPWWMLLVFVIVTALGAIWTRHHRGLANAAGRLDLVIASPRQDPDRPPSGP